MLHRVFGFADLTAGQVMIPRTELVAVAADTPLRELLRKIGQGEPHAAAGLPRRPRQRDRHAARDRSGEGAGGGDIDVNAGALAREVLTVPDHARRRRSARGDAAAQRARGARHRRVRRHRGAGHVRVADGAHHRRDSGRDGRADAHRRAQRTGRPTSTAWRWSATSTQQFGLHIDEDTYTTIGGYVLGRLGRRARVGDIDRRRRTQDARRGARRLAGREGVAVEAEAAAAGTRTAGQHEDTSQSLTTLGVSPRSSVA